MHCFIQNVSCSLVGDWSGVGGRHRRSGRETQTGDQGLFEISYYFILLIKYIDKLDGQIIRCTEELCETLLQKSVTS